MSSLPHHEHQYVPPMISKNGFLFGVWLSAALSAITLATRLFSRFRGPKKLFADDWLIIVAWALCGLSAIVWQKQVSYIYIVRDVIAGNIPPSESFAEDSKKSWQSQLFILMFWSTSVFMVKLSFLLFFRRLRRNVTKGQYLWWASLCLTVSVYFVWIGVIPYKCLTRSLDMKVEDNATDCARLKVVTLVTSSALDIATNLLNKLSEDLVWKTRIQIRQNLALLGIFSLVMVTIAITIVRVTVIAATTDGTKQYDAGWTYFCVAVEVGVAIVIACVSAFPQRFSPLQISEKPLMPLISSLRRATQRSRYNYTPLDYLLLDSHATELRLANTEPVHLSDTPSHRHRDDAKSTV